MKFGIFISEAFVTFVVSSGFFLPVPRNYRRW
jgi:hypothetical protein